jgi:tetraacyldisaccharide 4'-kinase
MAWIERHWRSITPVSALLYPVSLLYGAVAASRRTGANPATLPVPVVVIGNVTAGGTGKTPLALWLAAELRERGFHPGIVCSGYGGSQNAPQAVTPESDPRKCGDEAVLLARRSNSPVWAGADRVASARGLLAAEGCDVVLCDDGLQHHALARDAEICVVDGARGFGNGWLLPAGPLREPVSRIESVDAVVVNGDAAHPSISRLPASARRYGMRLEGREFRNLLNPALVAGAEHFRGKRVHAIAGIGDPGRFFRHLQEMGLDFTAHPFPDHYPYTASSVEFPDADAVLMTEKDAVKCRRFANENHWELPVDTTLDSALADLVVRKLRAVAR